MSGSATPVTVVVVPRERFSLAERTIETLVHNTEPGFRAVVVDAGSPRNVRGTLERLSERYGFRLLRRDHCLSPNQARNIGFREVETPYAVFLDNDAIVTPGWLPPLVRCAEETGAAIVGPLYLIGEPAEGIIHMAGGDCHIVEAGGHRRLIERHRLAGSRIDEVRPSLSRRRCELVEFHCMLVRTALLRRLGPLDERLLSTREHLDLCLQVRRSGGEIWFEPASAVSYLPPPPIDLRDVAFFLSRWSEAWNAATLRYFRAKWDLDEDDPHLRDQRRWLASHRRLALRPIESRAQKLLGARLARFVSLALAATEQVVNRMAVRAPRPAASSTPGR